MIVQAEASAAAIERAVAEAGGRIAWSTRPSAAIGIEAAVDEEELVGDPAPWDDEAPADLASPDDVEDFVAACLAGDRWSALAIAGRIFASPENLAAIDRILLQRRAA